MKQMLTRIVVSLVALAVLAGFASSPLLAQETSGEIRGTVTEAGHGDPLIGANVLLVGTTLGGVTDLEGEFSIRRVPAGQYTVLVRFVGYKQSSKDVTVRAGAVTTMDFALVATAVQLDEVVVTGQGAAIEKRRLSSTVETISARDIQLAPVKSVDQLLQGRIPGLLSFMPGGAPGTGARMQTRGVKSALNSTTPVIYVDGVRVDNSPQGRLAPGTGGQISSSLSDLVTGEIDHIEVIKGGAAATLYGSEAANGVIQVFTKKGSPGAARWNVNVTSGFDQAQVKNVWSSYTKDNYFQNGPFQSYRIGADGGTENLTYTVSAKMSENKGVSAKDQLDDKQYNISAGLRALTGEKSNIEFSSSYVRGSFGKQFNDNAIAAPVAGLEGEGIVEPQKIIGKLSGPALQRALNDPSYVRYLQDSTFNAYLLPNLHETVNRWIASSNFNYSPYSWWQNKFTLGIDYRKSETRHFSSIEAGPVISTPGGQLVRADREYMTLTANFNATFTLPDLGPVTQRFTAGAQAFRVNDREIRGIGTNFKIPGTINFDDASVITAAESNQELYSYGFIFQDQVGIWNRLFLDLGVRFDGNTAFGSTIPIQVYPKAGVAYNISEESFYPEELKPYASSLKFRASVGQTGNFPPPFTRDRSYQSNPYGTDAAFNFGNPGNSDLGPDKITSYDAGFDLGLFEDKVSVEFSYYKQITKNAQFNIPADVASGFIAISRRVNIGEIENKGIEVSVRANILNYENFEFNARASVATNDNVVTNMGGAAEFTVAGFAYAPMQVKEGLAIGTIKAFVPGSTEGIYIGGPTPKQTGSVSLEFVLFKDLTINALAEGAFGHYVLNQGLARRLVNALAALKSNTPGTTANNNIPAGATLFYDIFTTLNWPINPATGQFYPRNNASSYLVERGDFIKVREISMRYRVPREIFSGLYINASVRNPFILLQKARNADPESSFIPVRGVELGGIVGATVEAPIQWRFGIDVTL